MVTRKRNTNCSLKTEQRVKKHGHASDHNKRLQNLASFDNELFSLTIGLTLLESLIVDQICNEDIIGEFDPGSGRTLAACLIHASRADHFFREMVSGGRVSNT